MSQTRNRILDEFARLATDAVGVAQGVRREAETVLRNAIARDRENPFAWYQLGVVYEHRGDTPRAALASAPSQALLYGLPNNNSRAVAARVGMLPLQAMARRGKLLRGGERRDGGGELLRGGEGRDGGLHRACKRVAAALPVGD